MTYLDTNVGFCGSCYLAANWYLFGAEKKDRYVFVDGIPVTNRQLVSRFGTARFDDLIGLLGERVTRTTCPLIPLRLYAFFLNRRDRRRAAAELACQEINRR